jgi:hypothetical protein
VWKDQAKLTFVTGGLPGSREMQLYVIKGDAWSYTAPLWYGDIVPIPLDHVKLGSLGNLDADGLLLVALPARSQVTLRPGVDGTNFTAVQLTPVPAQLVIVQPAAGQNNAYPAQTNYNSTGPMAFNASLSGTNHPATINWKLKVEYQTPGGGPYAKEHSFSSANNQTVYQTFTAEGGRMTITASVTAGGGRFSKTITNYITGVPIPNATITTRLRSLYTPPAGGTTGLLTGIAFKESSYMQFDPNLTKYGLTSRWPVESPAALYPKGSYIGMMQVPVAMDTAWDWLVNTTQGAAIFAEKLQLASSYIADIRAQHPSLPALTGVQMENYALGLYVGSPSRYYVPAEVPSGSGQWQWQTTSNQSLLNYVSTIRNNIQP